MNIMREEEIKRIVTIPVVDIMKIMAFSDWRSLSMDIILDAAKDIQPDLIIYAGDDVSRFASKECRVTMSDEKIHKIEERLNPHEENIFSLLSKYTKYGVLAVIGNDCLKKHKKVITDGGAIDLHDKPAIFENIGFIGVEGGTKEIENPIGYTTYSGEEIKRQLLKQIRQAKNCGRMVLVSHNPPYGILDMAMRFGFGRIGSNVIKNTISSNKKIVLNLCGHVHLQGGNDEKLDHCLVVNVASHDDECAEPRIAIIEVSDDSKEPTVSWYEEEIRKIPQVGPNTAERLRKLGIRKFADFESALDGKIKTFPGVYDWHINYWKSFFFAKKKGTIISLESFILTKNIVFVDIETDIFQSVIWLIGVHNPEKGEFIQFFEKNPKKEKENLVNFYDYLRKNNIPQIVGFSNCKLEERKLTERMRYHKILRKDETLTTFFDLGTWVQTRIIGTQNYQLKTLASAFGYTFKHVDIDGRDIGCIYGEYMGNRKKRVDWTKLLEYNKDDVMSLSFLIEKINESHKNYSKLTSK